MTPLTRLKAVHRRLEILKESPDIWVNYLVLDMLTNLLPAPLARRALNTHGVTLVASNLPGKYHSFRFACFIFLDSITRVPLSTMRQRKPHLRR